MKKILFAFAILLILALGIVFVQNYIKTKSFSLLKKSATATIGNHTFTLSIARSQKEKEVGLSETKLLSENQGMIFIFDKPDYYSFWMKNMKFPIDIIYINNDAIVTIIKNAQIIKPQDNPTVYFSTQPADKVLEIQAGLSEKYKFKEGDRVKYENLSN